jgi:hypothetical protein
MGASLLANFYISLVYRPRAIGWGLVREFWLNSSVPNDDLCIFFLLSMVVTFW